MNYLLLILGLVLILAGANFLVEYSSKIAKTLGISDFIIGMTIVGIGTSAPELVVSILSAIKGNPDMAVGNVIGSNIFNTTVILGATAIVFPIALTSNNIRKDIPFGLLAALTLLILGNSIFLDGTQSNIIYRVNGLLLLFMFGIFIAYTIYSSISSGNSINKADELEKKDITEYKPLIINFIIAIVGLSLLLYGGSLFVNSASKVARSLGVPNSIIAITIMAGGTSLPELASCIVAALKKNTDLALGNVIGSNVSNIFLILGTSSVITPLNMAGITNLDLSILSISALLLFLFAFTFKKRQIDRIEGALLLIIYIAYIAYSIINL